MRGIGAKKEYQIEKIPVVGSCDEDEGGKGDQESDETVHRRDKSNWKAQREMVKCSGQEC